MQSGGLQVFDRASWQRKVRVPRRFRRAEKVKFAISPNPGETVSVEGV